MNVFLNFTINLISLFTFSLSLGLPATRKNRPNVRIYGGDDAAPGQFPFMVSLNLHHGELHNCGGSIINENWVVTAAHCMVDHHSSEYTVLAGTTLLNKGGTLFNVSKIIIHSSYTHYNHTGDIALLKIDGSFKFDDSVQMIEVGQVSGNDPVTVIGWGETDEGSLNELQYANLTALSNDDCTKKSEGGDFIFPRGPGQVCALASEGISPCYGDSGGPLIFNGTLVGIVSYGVSPCANGYPDVYTRTSYYLDWINENTQNI